MLKFNVEKLHHLMTSHRSRRNLKEHPRESTKREARQTPLGSQPVLMYPPAIRYSEEKALIGWARDTRLRMQTSEGTEIPR